MSTSGLEFSIKTTGSSVGPESVAAAIANAQSGSRNILGFAGPVAGAGTDYLTVAATPRRGCRQHGNAAQSSCSNEQPRLQFGYHFGHSRHYGGGHHFRRGQCPN